jgi:hypothetical protein
MGYARWDAEPLASENPVRDEGEHEERNEQSEQSQGRHESFHKYPSSDLMK